MGQYHKLPISVLDTFPGADAEAVHGLFLEELRDFHRKSWCWMMILPGSRRFMVYLFIQIGNRKA